MPSLEIAVKFCENVAKDDAHGYSQYSRWGPDYDCSSLVISGLKAGGFDVGSATYTGNMRSQLSARGWTVLNPSVAKKRGDILLNDASHTAMMISASQLVQASKSETGGITGKTGDQTGREIWTCGYYSFPWNCVLRYAGAATDGALSVDGYLGTGTVYALQKSLGTAQDGIISSQWIGNRVYHQSDTSCFEWVSKSTGSDVVKALQRKIGLSGSDVDGDWGKATNLALQKYLGTTQDGYLSSPSDAIKALQRKLNAGGL
ncbi:MAG: hypothetical protein LBR39_02950 [Coriobacteriales bacterium]|jgi:hypothetical protein|nr:hypothetical protein [Coriobacteriales bacterium]